MSYDYKTEEIKIYVVRCNMIVYRMILYSRVNIYAKIIQSGQRTLHGLLEKIYMRRTILCLDSRYYGVLTIYNLFIQIRYQTIPFSSNKL